MKIDVAKHIVQLLEQNESIRVPGLGNFNLLHRSASFTSGKQAMVPPKVEVEFTEEIGEGDDLAKALKKTYGIKKKEANQAIEVFSQKVLNNLLNLDRVRITGLGMLEKMSDGSISFNANKGFLSQYYIGLPEVSTQVKKSTATKSTIEAPKEVSTPAVKKEVVKETIIKPEPKAEPKIEPEVPKEIKAEPIVKETIATVTEPATPVVPVAATATAVSSLASSDSKESAPKNKTWREIEQEKLANKTQVKNDPPPVLSYDDDDGGRGCLWPFIGLLALCLIGLFFFKYCGTKEIPNPLAKTDTLDSVLQHFDEDQSELEAFETDNAKSANDVESQANKTNSSPNSSSKSSSNSNSKTKPLATEDASISSNPNQCIIITGVFNSEANTRGMSNHLKTSGYVPYVERKGDKFRVGLKFDCRDTDLKSFIRSIRRNIAKDAWYLQPSLRVD